MQLGIAKPLRLDGSHGLKHIVAVVAGAAMALPHVTQLFMQRKPSGILNMATVDDVSERRDPLARIVFQPDRAHDFAVNMGGLFAGAQIADDFVAMARCDTKRD